MEGFNDRLMDFVVAAESVCLISSEYAPQTENIEKLLSIHDEIGHLLTNRKRVVKR